MKVHRRFFRESEEQNPQDIVPGGLGDASTNQDFDPEQLKIGTLVELEHTDDVDLATEIARDHLTEDPDYYKKLQSIEKESVQTTANYTHSVHEAVNELVSIYHELMKQDFKKKSKILSKVKDSLTNLVQADKLISEETNVPSLGERLRLPKH